MAKQFLQDFIAFLRFFAFYCKRKTIVSSVHFEKHKNRLVKFLLLHRGRYNRPFLHISTMGVLGIGVLVAPFLADTYPLFSSQASVLGTTSEEEAQSILVGEDVFETEISKKPRDSIITYAVQKGDTLSTVAEKFEVSVDTIRWGNNLTSDSLSIGQAIKILPVTGIAHKVTKGESVYSIAKKYDTDAQKIVDFPFNEFANAETFALVEGQILIVPDGVRPSEQPRQVPRQVYIAQGPTTVYASGFTWPLRGGLSQYFSWYHTGIDITSPAGTPIVAGQSGKVTMVSIGTWGGGYGTHIIVDGGGGYSSLYSHMSGVNVNIGDDVEAGQTVVGWVGMTGRTTGPHLHFEIRSNGAPINPMGSLQ